MATEAERRDTILKEVELALGHFKLARSLVEDNSIEDEAIDLLIHSARRIRAILGKAR